MRIENSKITLIDNNKKRMPNSLLIISNVSKDLMLKRYSCKQRKKKPRLPRISGTVMQLQRENQLTGLLHSKNNTSMNSMIVKQRCSNQRELLQKSKNLRTLLTRQLLMKKQNSPKTLEQQEVMPLKFRTISSKLDKTMKKLDYCPLLTKNNLDSISRHSMLLRMLTGTTRLCLPSLL